MSCVSQSTYRRAILACKQRNVILTLQEIAALAAIQRVWLYDHAIKPSIYRIGVAAIARVAAFKDRPPWDD